MKTLTGENLQKMRDQMRIYVSEGYTITAQKPEIGKTYHNNLENVDYCATKNDIDKVLLIGTVNEPWFAPMQKVLKQYCKEDGTRLSEKDITESPLSIVRLRSYNAAIQLQEDLLVLTKQGYSLKAKKGDYLVCSVKENENGFFPDDEWGYWTINKDVFHNTNCLYN